MAKKRRARHRRQANATSSAPVGLIIVVLVLGGVVGSQFVGPGKGWITNMMKAKPAVEQEVAEADAPVEEVKSEASADKPKSKPVAETAKTEAVKEVVKKAPRVKSEMELRLEEIYKKELAKLPKPVFNKRVQIQLKKGDKYFTHVSKVVGPRIYLEKMEPYNGSMNFPYTALSTKVVLDYFPEYVAKKRAMKILDEEMAAKLKPLPEVTSVQASASNTSMMATFDKWSPQVSQTPKFMGLAVEEFQDWIAAQQRRTGVSLADQSFAKRQGSALVLYVYASKKFVSNDYDTRLQLAEGMRQFWGMRCMSNGIGKSSNAYVCIVDGRIKKRIGGSVSTKNAEDVFVVD